MNLCRAGWPYPRKDLIELITLWIDPQSGRERQGSLLRDLIGGLQRDVLQPSVKSRLTVRTEKRVCQVAIREFRQPARCIVQDRVVRGDRSDLVRIQACGNVLLS